MVCVICHVRWDIPVAKESQRYAVNVKIKISEWFNFFFHSKALYHRVCRPQSFAALGGSEVRSHFATHHQDQQSTAQHAISFINSHETSLPLPVVLESHHLPSFPSILLQSSSCSTKSKIRLMFVSQVSPQSMFHTHTVRFSVHTL